MHYDPSLPDESPNVPEGSTLGEAGTLIVGVCVLAFAAVAVLSLTIELVVAALPHGIEAKLFEGVWKNLETIDEHPHRDRIQALTESLVEHDELPRDHFRIAVMDADFPNAMAFPGGMIIFTTALLDSVESENELAFVVGHELGHYRNRDHLEGLGRGLSWALVATALGLGDDAVSALAGLSASLTQRSFDRQQELDADVYGLWLLEQRYGHAAGTRRVFDVLLANSEEPTGEHEGSTFTRYLESHPPHPQRIAALQQTASERGLALTGAATPWP